jgi:glutamate--cysteine ligase
LDYCPLSQSISYTQTLTALKQADKASLTFYRGIEKEGLRVKTDTRISQVPHQASLGSALTHPYITTDYSEALLEFITPVRDSAAQVLDFLQTAHSYTYQHLGDELIWPASMPGVIDEELDVPIAQYGQSNVGQLKHVYRHGLWHRYGRKMQCIAGLHYNFSVADELWSELAAIQGKQADQNFISEGYFSLIRNFRRNSWLLLYLFGASPTLDKSFVKGKEHPLKELDDESLYLPYATSLRMSGLGYQNNAQDGLFVCFNGLPSYTNTLQQAMKQSVPAYEALGVKKQDNYFQLNTNLLQIENEYYSDVRPKRNSKQGEKPLTALNEHGVEYIEVRCLDLNPFMGLGIDAPQIHFMDLFLSYCLLSDSPVLEEAECKEVADNQHNVVLDGRNPDFTLMRKGVKTPLKSWAREVLQEMKALAELLDDKQGGQQYQSALALMLERVEDSELTPSAQVLHEMKEKHLSFSEFALTQAKLHSAQHQHALEPKKASEWLEIAEKSLKKQQDIEISDSMSFDHYLDDYLKKA